jgi:flagellar hook protein FlgE
MSLMTALYSGASGLQGNSLELSVVGDNIANANTIGFKGSRAAFADAMAETLIGEAASGAGQRGLGSKLQMVQRILTQGALTNTGLNTDLAIEGSGFFVVKGSHNGAVGQYYTRAGQFTVDNDGYMVNLEGMRVQGYQADATGSIVPSGVGDIQVGNASASPRASANVTIRANLQADATSPAAWDVTQAATTSNFSTGTTVYDSLGSSHQIDMYFRKNGAGDWEWHGVTDGGGLTGGVAGTPTEVASGTLTYDSQGRLTAATTAVNNFTPLGANSPQPLNFNFGTPSPGGTGLDGVTQFAAPSATSFLSQDGYAPGDLSRISIDPKGQVVGSFTNGQTRILAQETVANFEAPDQLNRVGGNLYSAMPQAGTPVIGAPSTADRGAIVAGALEQSNVDMAGEFIRMIAAQRDFQANAKTLNTADQLLAELMTIKR